MILKISDNLKSDTITITIEIRLIQIEKCLQDHHLIIINMPKKFTKTYRRKRPYYKRYRRRNYRKKRATNMPINTPLRKLLKAKLNYTESGSFPTTLQLYNNYTFSANGLYDPNKTGTGHQPMAFDQLMSMYYHYTVIGAHCKVTFINNTPDDVSDEPLWVGIGISRSSSTTWTSISQFEEQTGTKMVLCNSTQKNGNSRTLTATINPPKYLGISKPLSEDTLKGTSSTNPNEELFFHLFISTLGSVSPECNMKVDLSYITIFSEPLKLVQS